MIAPGATLGVLGGGQLGRMFAQAAQRMGYAVVVYDPDPHSPAGRVAEHVCAAYDDMGALSDFAARCAAVTLEFENIPLSALHHVAEQGVLAPHAQAVAVAQDRAAEKRLFAALGLNPVPWRTVEDDASAAQAWSELASSAAMEVGILKTNRLGYDGKGQRTVRSAQECVEAWRELGEVSCVLEARIALQQELSVVLARNARGDFALYEPGENVHRAGVLHTTTVPANVDSRLALSVQGMARALAESLDYVGVMALELFVDTQGRVWSNEMAPRPHNSGHHTLDACWCSQFEQQVRALAGLPLGDPSCHSPVVMLNLLGDVWEHGEPAWPLQLPGVALHLYGKAQARPGRKMGHINLLGASHQALLQHCEQVLF